MLVRAPGLERMQLELELASFLKVQDDLARRRFEAVLAGGVPEAEAADVENFLAAMQEHDFPRRWREAGAGVFFAPSRPGDQEWAGRVIAALTVAICLLFLAGCVGGKRPAVHVLDGAVRTEPRGAVGIDGWSPVLTIDNTTYVGSGVVESLGTALVTGGTGRHPESARRAPRRYPCLPRSRSERCWTRQARAVPQRRRPVRRDRRDRAFRCAPRPW